MDLLKEFLNSIDESKQDGTNLGEINEALIKIEGELNQSEGNEELKRQCIVERECYSFNKSFEIDSHTKKVKGVSWKLNGVNTNEDGSKTPFVWPDISTYSLTDFEYIVDRYKTAKNPYIKAEFGLILYFQQPTPFSKHNDFKKQLVSDLLNLAKQYKEKAEKDASNYYFTYLYSSINGAINIAVKSNFSDEIKDVTEWVSNLIQGWDLERKDSMRTLIDCVSLLTSNYKKTNEHFNSNDIIDSCLKGMAIQESKYIWGAIYILDSTQKLDAKAGVNAINYKEKKAQLYEKLAEEAEGTTRQLAAISFVEDALRLYQELKDNDSIARLSKKYSEIRGTGNFGTVSKNFDEEYVNKVTSNIDEAVERKTSIDILEEFAFSLMYSDSESIKINGEKSLKESISMSMFGSSIADKFGNTIAQYNTEEEKKEHAFWQAYGFDFQIGTQWLCYYFMQALKADKLDFASTKTFLQDSWLNEGIERFYAGSSVTITPLDILLPPLELFFEELNKWKADNSYSMNTVVLTDSLTLKIEALLRYKCEKIGVATFKTKVGNVVMEKTLDVLLSDLKHLDDNPTGFKENDRLFIKFVLSEKTGQNLRNRIAHGLMDINEYGFDNIIILFSIILRFGNYKFKN
jgi:hypothetical protein